MTFMKKSSKNGLISGLAFSEWNIARFRSGTSPYFTQFAPDLWECLRYFEEKNGSAHKCSAHLRVRYELQFVFEGACQARTAVKIIVFGV